MAKFIGRQQEVGIGRESSRGTIVAPSKWVPKVNFSVEDKVSKSRFQGGYGNILGGDDAVVSDKYAQGDLEFEAQDDILPMILYAVFGGLTSASFNGAYKHSLSIANSVQHQSLSLHMNDPIGAAESPAKTIAYARSMVDTFDIISRPGELIQCRAGFIAAAHRDWTRQTPSYAAQNKFTHQHAFVKVANDLSGLDAASKISVREIELNIRKNVIRENSLGTVQPVDILNRKIEISGKLTLTHEDRTYRDYMLDGTKKAVRVGMINSGVTIGSTNPQFQLDLSVCDFTEWEPAHPIDDISTQQIMFSALYDVTNDVLIGSDSFAVNETASY